MDRARSIEQADAAVAEYKATHVNPEVKGTNYNGDPCNPVDEDSDRCVRAFQNGIGAGIGRLLSKVGIVASGTKIGPQGARILADVRAKALRRVTRQVENVPRVAGAAVPRGPVRPNQIHGLEEALSYARRGGGRIRRDATEFRNENNLLPPGSYRKWTVRTPGVAGRGTRRVVVNQESGRAYYTWNHYRNFVKVVP